MENTRKENNEPHILVLPYQTQGHINPMLQFCKRLASKGAKVTLAVTNFISNTMHPITCDTVGIETVSDGFDKGGFSQSESVAAYLERFAKAATQDLTNLIKKYENSNFPINCVIYDAVLPWALDVTKDHGLIGVSFFTQACAVNYIYYYVYHGKLSVPISSNPIKIPGLPELEIRDMPSFIYVHGTYPAYFELLVNQFRNLDKADYVFVNSFYDLEVEVADSLAKVVPLWTIGPTVPSFYLDKRVEKDDDYGINLFQLDQSTTINWLNTKAEGSVIYVALGSMSSLNENQMEELALGLKSTNHNFLWVVRASEESKIPKNFIEETCEKGLIINWSPQLKVLSHKAVGCFLSHGGWNSTIEALSLGVPLVVMPQWTDQTTNAKLVQDVWKVGVRVDSDENGLVGREEIKGCIMEVMEGVMGKEMRKNATKWKDLAKQAVDEGGNSDTNIDKFVSKLSLSQS